MLKVSEQFNTEKIDRSSGRQAGFTLIELMVSITLFIIVTGAIYGLLKVARADRTTTNQRLDVMKNLRVALNTMGRDTLDAGYSYQKNGALIPNGLIATRLGVPPDTDGQPDRLVGVISANNLNPNSLQNSQYTDEVSFVYRDTSFNSNVTLPITGATQSPANVVQLTISSAAGVPVNTVCSLYDLYVIESQNSSAIGMVTTVPTGVGNTKFLRFANADPLGLNLAWASSLLRPCASSADTNCTTYPATIKKVTWVSYKVLNDGTLVRTVYGNNPTGTALQQVQDMPLAYGIENMQISYVMDDGTVADDPVAGPDGVRGTIDDTPLNLKLVRQITVSLKAQSPQIDPRTGQRNKVTLSATFNTRNLGYDAG